MFKFFCSLIACLYFGAAAQAVEAVAHSSPILNLLQITPSEQSIDYVSNKRQFQLHTLLTEQRHPKTYRLSQLLKINPQQAVEDLLSVDQDISTKFAELAENPASLEQGALAIERAMLKNKKIYVYGCGATGRLAKQVESSFWRPFWNKIKKLPIWVKLQSHFPDIENALIGEMTGGDRALISSLEGFEDLQLIAGLQLQDHGIQKGDAVFAITEGGETSSVIGSILSAFDLHGSSDETESKNNLFFIYNNPDDLLWPFDRSRSVIENEGITKICLSTGPQSITGSTRMQAATSETFAMGVMLEQAISQVLQKHLTDHEIRTLGFEPSMTISQRLQSFLPVQQAVSSQSVQIGKLIEHEASAYASNHFSTYFARDALITVFTDATERSPTFKLYPFDTIHEPARKSWIQVWTPANSIQEAWHTFLGRPFRGLDPSRYEEPFMNNIHDPYLRRSALASLRKSGNDQQNLYDLSYSAYNQQMRGPHENDLGILILLDEEIRQGIIDSECVQKWLNQFSEAKATVDVILVASPDIPNENQILSKFADAYPNACILKLPIKAELDPLALRQHIALKMLLNAHSTAVMAKLGRVVGNTMVNVNPGNLKLYGRATFMIQSHVNDHLPKSAALTYAEANAVLFNAIDYIKNSAKSGQQTSEVSLSIIRILEAVKRGTNISWEQAEEIGSTQGLEAFLQNYSH